MVLRLLTVALLGSLLLGGCGRREETQPRPARDTTRAEVSRTDPTENFEAAPAQPSGPQIGRSDSLLNAIKPALEEWAAMWRTVLPGFEVDSLWAGPRESWDPGAPRRMVRQHEGRELPGLILGVQSPQGGWVLDIDSYQVIQQWGDSLEVGGEPESQPALVESGSNMMRTVAFCGTSCGYHWGAWLTEERFVLGGWQDADDYSKWAQGTLAIYDLENSTVARYVTRIVPRADYQRYYAAWERWLLKRWREVQARPRT